VLGADVGIGVVDPAATTPTRIETDASTALIEFQPAGPGQPPAFDELTVVTIFRRPDGTFLAGFPEEDQYPPFFDYSATNGSNTHAVATGAVVRMAFCLLGSSRFPAGYPDGVRIGHNPDATVPGPRFEIIPEDEAVADYAGDLACENLQPRLASFGRGLMGLARALFLPSPLMAVAVGTRGPLGGLPPSLSDFGVVNATSYFGYEDGEPLWSGGLSFWNRRTAAPGSNSAFPVYVSTFNAAGVAGGTLPTPFRVDRSGWYGQLSTGNYIGTQATGDAAGSGGTSTSPSSGVFISPEIEVPSVSSAVELRFKTWWEIESVNPSRFDIMSVELEHGGEVTVLKRLNPGTDPTSPILRANLAYTSGGFPNIAPTWQDEAIDISAYRGETVRIRFAFNTVDHQYNGFRGWMVDDVRISTGTSGEGGPILLRRSAAAAAASLIPADQLPRIPRP
jgi:hypothetical protein